MSNYRSPLRIIQTDWRSGETDPTLRMRVDSTALANGAQILTNVLLYATGAAARRPGMVTKAQLTLRSRLVEFEFDANEKYVCGFGNQYLRIYDAAGAVIATFNTLADCPWTATTAWEINLIQKGDVMIIVHPGFKPKRLRRTGLSSFVMETLSFSVDTSDNVINQPYLRRAPQPMIALGLNLWTEGVGRTLTASAAVFASSWIGERLRIWNKEIEITAFTSSTVVTVTVRQTIKVELRPAPFRVELATPQNIVVTHVGHGIVGDGTGHAVVLVDGSVDLFGIVAANINGTRTIRIRDTDHYDFDAGGGAFATASGDGGGAGVVIQPVAPTTISDWAEQGWSTRRGWPAAIVLHENRLWMGGSTGLPTFLAGSAVGDYYDFNVRDGLDDDSVQGIISASTRIVHLVSAKQLQIFCENSESVVETQNGEPITPGSFKVVNHTAYGCDPNVRPRLFDGGTLFAQKNGKNVRKLIYDFDTDQQVALPVSVIASHLINKPNDVAVLLGTPTRSEQYAFFVNLDGTVACFHSIESEKLNAWTRFTAGGGLFDSVCVIGTSVFFSVLRDGLYWLERFELDATDIWLDGATRIIGVPSADWLLGSLYANKTVDIMAHGAWYGRFAIGADGIWHHDEVVAGPVVAGYDPHVVMRPNAPDKEINDGPITSEIRRIVASTLHFHQTTSAIVQGVEMLGFNAGQDPSASPALFSGKKRVRHLGYGRDTALTITQEAPGMPGPLVVLGMVHEVSI